MNDSALSTFSIKKRKKTMTTVSVQAYCVKCKAKKDIKDSKTVTMKNGREALKGSCDTCGTGMYRILGKK